MKENTSKHIIYYENINDFLFLASLLFIVSFYLDGNIYYKYLATLFGLIILIRYLIIKSKVIISVLFFLICLTVFFLVKSLYYGGVNSESDFLFIFAQVGLSFYLIYGKYNKLIISVVFYLSAFFFFIQILRGVSPSQIIIYSENIINFIFIALGIALYFVRYIEKNNILLHPAVLVVIIATITTGRSGIIASLLLLVVVIFSKYKLKTKYFFITLLILLLYSQKFINYILLYIESISTRFGKRLSILENVRFNIWESYLQSLNFPKLLFGFDNSKLHLFYGFENPHNSFLSGHYVLGVMQIILIIIILYTLYIFFRSKNTFIAILLIILLIRASTDKVLFTGNFDFVYISILIYGIHTKFSVKQSVNRTTDKKQTINILN